MLLYKFITSTGQIFIKSFSGCVYIRHLSRYRHKQQQCLNRTISSPWGKLRPSKDTKEREAAQSKQTAPAWLGRLPLWRRNWLKRMSGRGWWCGGDPWLPFTTLYGSVASWAGNTWLSKSCRHMCQPSSRNLLSRVGRKLTGRSKETWD